MSKLPVLISAYACAPPDYVGEGAGEAQLGFNIAREMSEQYDVTVITQSENRDFLKDYDFCTFAHVHVPFLSFLKKFNFGIQAYYYLWQIAAYLKARKLHKQKRFVLAHHATYANGWLPSFIGALLPVPFIWGPVGGGQRTPRTFVRHYPFLACLQEFFRTLAQALSRVDPFVRRCASRARLILACNKETRDRFFKKQKHKVFYFPVTGIEEDSLKTLTESTARQPRVFRVLMAGRMIPLKGFDIGIKAFARLAREHPEAELVIVGDGPEKPRLVKLIKRYGINARMIPWLAKKDLFSLMKQCDVFLFPSLRDGGGAVAVEAMTAGLPIVCFTIGGPDSTVTNKSGIKILAQNPLQSIRDMARALCWLKNNPARLDALRKGARERARAFRWKELSMRLNNAYELVLRSRKSSSRLPKVSLMRFQE